MGGDKTGFTDPLRFCEKPVSDFQYDFTGLERKIEIFLIQAKNKLKKPKPLNEMNLDGFCGISLLDTLCRLSKIMFVDFAGPKHHSVPNCITDFNISM